MPQIQTLGTSQPPPELASFFERYLTCYAAEVLPGARSTGDGLFCSTRSKLRAEDGRLIGDMEYHYHLVDEDQGLRIKYASMGKIHYWM